MRDKRRAVFLDKDGTLIENVPYNVEPARVALAAGALPALRLMASCGYRLIVISNQPGIARGYFTEEALAATRQRLAGLLAEGGVRLAGFYYCPHHPQGSVPRYAVRCLCRKPQAGLLHGAARDHGILLADSWFIGDILDDVEAGRRAGCRAVLLDNGNETEWRSGPLREPHFVARDLERAARHIVLAGPAAARVRAGVLP